MPCEDVDGVCVSCVVTRTFWSIVTSCCPLHSCGGGIGMALLVRDHLIIFVDATDLHNVRGCTFIPPYRDEYGEPDPGFR